MPEIVDDGRVTEVLESVETLIDTRLAKHSEDLSRHWRETYAHRPNFAGIDKGLPGVEDEASDFSFRRAILIASDSKFLGAEGFELERDIFREMESKAVSAQTDSGGGFLIPTQIRDEVLKPLMADSVIVQAGARVLRNLKGDISFAKESTSPSAVWVSTEAEEAISLSSPTLSDIQLRLKTVAALVRITRKMVRQSSPSAETWIREAISERCNLALDKAALLGKGSESEPRGILNDPDLSTATDFTSAVYSGASQDFSITMRSMIQALRERDVPIRESSVSWICEPKAVRGIEAARDLDGRPLLTDPRSQDTTATRVFGRPLYWTSEITSSDESELRMLVADLSRLYIGEWGSLELAVSDEGDSNFVRGRVSVRALWDVDIALVEPLAVQVASGYDLSDIA